ncbi:MAG: Pyridoxamine 5'-phosphate oxidase [Firmicutes bacterium ADurb.Bin506]|nr:MAG: Pyridoxamine 5'-phosphate oxidase [Firmicutes bacterium ADurb.Bin506]
MRRVDREVASDEAMRFLAEAADGVLSMVGTDGAPYAVPVNHAVVDGCIVIHCARQGQKIDNLRADARVCYTVYRATEIDFEELTTRYMSACAFGRAELVEDVAVKRQLLERMTEHLAPGAAFTCNDEQVARTGLIRIWIDSVTGKANR